MTKGINLNTANKIGTCPHGLPQGACPICSGMMSGGSSSRDVRRNAGEMTWNECYAMGQVLKAQREKTLNDKQAELQAMQNTLVLKNSIKFLTPIINFTSNFLNSQPLINKIVTNIATQPAKLAVKVLNELKNIVQNVLNTVTENINKLKEGLINITDKLAALYGEAKNALEKTIAENFKNVKKKFFGLLGMVDTEMEQGEDEKEIEEEKRSMDIKRLKEKISKILKRAEDK